MTIYLLNSPVLTDYGEWKYEGPLSLQQARQKLDSKFESAIGHAAAAEMLSTLLQLPVPVKRQSIKMNVDDQALVFRILRRLEEGQLLSRSELEQIPFELGWLVRTK